MRLTVAQALVRYLAAQWSERDGERRRVIPAMLGILGHGNVCGLGEALADPELDLPLIAPKHEQAMVHAGIGYAKASRRLATLACTTSIGPGATNLVTGAATATTNRLPVLLLPADTFATRRPDPVLQQLEHAESVDWTVNECLRPVSRHFDRVTRPEQLCSALPMAMRALLDPVQCGAVTLALAQDVQGEAFDFPAGMFEPRVWRVRRPAPDPDEAASAADALRAARRPLIVAGGGVRHAAAEAELAALADGCGIPVAETSAGKGAYRGELLLGGLGVNGTRAANEVAATADVVLCVGTRLSDFTTGSHTLFAAPDVRLVAVNVCAADAHKLGALAVVGDARPCLVALLRALEGARSPREHREAALGAVGRWRAAVAEDLAPCERLTQGQALAELNRHVRAGDWVVAAAGGPPGDLLKLWEVPEGSATHIEFAFSCMGHELPAAIGIRMAEPDAGEVYAVLGDGTYLLANGDLVTAVEQRLKVTVVLLVNGGYRSIQALQDATGTPAVGTEFQADLDYAGNARSLGAEAVVAADVEELAAALTRARESAGVQVVVCVVEPRRPLLGSGAFWDLGVPEVSRLGSVRAAAEAQALGRARQRLYGWESAG